MMYLYALVAAATAFVVWRMRAPADLRLNRRFFSRFLRDSTGRGPNKVQLKRIPVWGLGPANEEQAYFHVQAGFPDGSQQEVTVEVLYPLESLQREREQKMKPTMAEDFSPMQNPAGMGGQSTLADEANKFKQDPLQELTEERKLIEQKTAQFDCAVEQLRRINSHSELFPRLIAYERARHIAVLGAVGMRRLDVEINGGKREECKELLPSFLASLAAFHAQGDELAQSLPDKGAHSQQVIRSQITEALRGLSVAGVLATTTPLAELLAATSPIWTAGADYLGPRLADASPRGLFVHGGAVRPLQYGGLRRDITLLDVIELLCDPAMPLSPAEELSLIEHYLAARFPGKDTQDAVRIEMLHLAVYYRLVLAKHLAEYCSALKQPQGEKRSSLAIPYWDSEATSRNLASLRFYETKGTVLPVIFA